MVQWRVARDEWSVGRDPFVDPPVSLRVPAAADSGLGDSNRPERPEDPADAGAAACRAGFAQDANGIKDYGSVRGDAFKGDGAAADNLCLEELVGPKATGRGCLPRDGLGRRPTTVGHDCVVLQLFNSHSIADAGAHTKGDRTNHASGWQGK